MKFILFIAAVIALGVITIKLKRKNKETYKKALHDLFGEDIFEEPKTEAVPLPQVKEEKDEEAESVYVRPRSLDNNSVIIPEEFIFKDEFKVLLYMAEKYPEEMNLTLYDPVSELSINLFEERTGIKLTEELKALYKFTNGLDADRCTLEFEPLEIIEREYKRGYSDWAKEGDANDYVYIGSVIGDGEYLCMEKKSGHIFWHDCGEMTDYISVENILYWLIEFVYEGNISNGDQIIEEYLKKQQ